MTRREPIESRDVRYVGLRCQADAPGCRQRALRPAHHWRHVKRAALYASWVLSMLGVTAALAGIVAPGSAIAALDPIAAARRLWQHTKGSQPGDGEGVRHGWSPTDYTMPVFLAGPGAEGDPIVEQVPRDGFEVYLTWTLVMRRSGAVEIRGNEQNFWREFWIQAAGCTHDGKGYHVEWGVSFEMQDGGHWRQPTRFVQDPTIYFVGGYGRRFTERLVWDVSLFADGSTIHGDVPQSAVEFWTRLMFAAPECDSFADVDSPPYPRDDAERKQQFKEWGEAWDRFRAAHPGREKRPPERRGWTRLVALNIAER